VRALCDEDIEICDISLVLMTQMGLVIVVEHAPAKTDDMIYDVYL
jgi:hypothetical protein